MLILIGSKALSYHMDTRIPADLDLVGTYEDLMAFKKQLKNVQASYPMNNGKKQYIKADDKIYDCEIAWENSSASKLVDFVKNDSETMTKDGFLIPSLDVLYMLKMSHRYLKNSPHFTKTMNDIHMLRKMGATLKPEHMDFYKERQKATYNYGHPKLNVTKNDFFAGDGVNYVYEHDTIHESTKTMAKPAYAYFKPDESEVFCSRDMFYELDERVRLAAVLEETQVLALERSQIPFGNTVHPKKSFDIALMKVCTSITSGWFREFAWENYAKVQAMYNPDYVNKFWQDVEKGIVKKLEAPALKMKA